MSSQTTPLFMNLSDFAAHLAISLSTLRRRVDEGIIPVLHEGRRVSVPVAIAEKRYMQYLIGKEREYRAARASAANTQQRPAAAATFADRAWEVAELSGMSGRNLHVDCECVTGGEEPIAPAGV